MSTHAPLPRTILLVDDIPDNITVLTEMLTPPYRTRVATQGAIALRIAASPNPPDLILLDIMMPGMDGYEVCRRLKENPDTRRIPVIFITALDELEDERIGLELGAVDYLTKPIRPTIVLARIKTHLALRDQTLELERLVAERTADLERTRREIIMRLGRAAEFKDNETGHHVMRMSHFARLLGRAAGMGEESAELLFNAAQLHDVGKIGIPDHVLLKKGRLEGDEWAIMKRHPEMGGAIIGEHDDDLLKTARILALTHHEKWDGSGYPEGLAGESIPLVGRIVAIADVFDALTAERPYKPAWEIEDALYYIESQAGIHFDPRLAPLFRSLLPDILAIRARFADTPPADIAP
ncbi:putative cyclic di-GMP phosphodiesterase [Candidatus Magnetaquicoccaceae bacterium FCR-1]|uniref:Cyclic di-GMP phosphodiesterase n=1 Tax=Candidatus Magnetaquiglobus chichijimensis TaxID=3141448 RepID=A0ABQ0C8F2_9PROT